MTRYYPSKVVPRDPSLPHQIVIGTTPGNSHLIYVSCNCRRKAGETCEPLEIRELWQPGDALAVWHKHMEEVAA